VGSVSLSRPRPIEPTDSLAAFDCGEPTLNIWLLKTALRAEREKTARTYVVTPTDTNLVVGYYCLSSFSVERSSIGGGRLARNAPPMVPAVLLGRLAVDLSHQGAGLGASLLHDAIDNASLVSARIGSRALIVDALSDEAAGFYERYGLRRFPADPLRLYHSL
jgi:predicted N-acetyltransferase YhbS